MYILISGQNNVVLMHSVSSQLPTVMLEKSLRGGHFFFPLTVSQNKYENTSKHPSFSLMASYIFLVHKFVILTHFANTFSVCTLGCAFKNCIMSLLSLF